MSYVEVQPSFYAMNFPQGPWHAGASGWTKSPWVTWGDNPAQAGPHRLATDGVGAFYTEPKTALLVIAGLAVAGAFAWYKFGHVKRFHRNRGKRRTGRWSRAYKDRLPDSAFLVVERGGEKRRVGGKTFTVPKKLRHLPYKNVQGRVDVPHLRDAISRAPQTTSLPTDKRRSVQKKAQRLLAQHGGYR